MTIQQISTLHKNIQYYKSIDAWGMAEILQAQLDRLIKEAKNGSHQSKKQ